MANKIFAGIQLPLRPAFSADSAEIRLVEDVVADVTVVEPFFGGYAEDFLADLGFDMVDELPTKERVKHA